MTAIKNFFKKVNQKILGHTKETDKSDKSNEKESSEKESKVIEMNQLNPDPVIFNPNVSNTNVSNTTATNIKNSQKTTSDLVKNTPLLSIPTPVKSPVYIQKKSTITDQKTQSLGDKLTNWMSPKTKTQVEKVTNWLKKSSEPLDVSFIWKNYKKLSFEKLMKNPHLSTNLKFRLPFKYFEVSTKKQDNNLAFVFETIIQLKVPERYLTKFFRDWERRYFLVYPTRSSMTKHVGNILGTFITNYYNPRNQLNFLNNFYHFYLSVQHYLHKDIRAQHEKYFLEAVLKAKIHFNQSEWHSLIIKRVIQYFPDQIKLPRHILKIFYLEAHRFKPGRHILSRGNLTWKEYDTLMKMYSVHPDFNSIYAEERIPFWFMKKRFSNVMNYKKAFKNILKYHQFNQDLEFYLDLLRTFSSLTGMQNNGITSSDINDIIPYLSEYYMCYQIKKNPQFDLTKIVSTQSLSSECLDFILTHYWNRGPNSQNVATFISLSQPLTPALVNKHPNAFVPQYLVYNRSLIEYPLTSFNFNQACLPSNFSPWKTPIEKVNILNQKGVPAKLDPDNSNYIIIRNCLGNHTKDPEAEAKVTNLYPESSVYCFMNNRNMPRKLVDRAYSYQCYSSKYNGYQIYKSYSFFGPDLVIMNSNTSHYVQKTSVSIKSIEPGIEIEWNKKT